MEDKRKCVEQGFKTISEKNEFTDGMTEKIKKTAVESIMKSKGFVLITVDDERGTEARRIFCGNPAQFEIIADSMMKIVEDYQSQLVKYISENPIV